MTTESKGPILNIFTDGASHGNPGPSGVGVFITDDKERVISEFSKYIGDATNNAAEYMAVIYALQEAFSFSPSKIILHLDSQLVARQLKGEYKVRDVNIMKFFGLALNLISKFDKVEIIEIPRELNKKADSLATRAVNLKLIS